MRKLGAGVVLIDERDGEVMYYLHELVPSIRTRLLSNDGEELNELTFESWDFFRSYNRICSLNKKKSVLEVEDDDFENLLKVFPYVREENGSRKVRVEIPPKILLGLLERGEFPSTEFSRIKNVFKFFLPNAEFGIEEKTEYGVNYYTTFVGGKTFVVVPEAEVERQESTPVKNLLKEVRQNILYLSKPLLNEETFLEQLKESIKEEYKKSKNNSGEEL